MTEEAAHPPSPRPAQPGGPPPPGGYGPTNSPPPPGGAGFTSRYGLIRPREGRYLAGVCAAIGRATNTDPVLWRVLLAVLGFFGGIGILAYVTAWLIIPGEGDTASPVESMLGRGRSSMSPVTVIVLSLLVAVSFGFIVTDAFRAVLLGAAILIGGALLLNRDNRGPVGVDVTPTPGGVPPDPAASPPGPVPPVSYPAPGLFSHPTAPPPGGPAFTAAQVPPAPEETSPVHSVTAPLPPAGYRPPFAPRGPYAGPCPPTAYQPAIPTAKPPKRHRERSPLGAATFSLIFLALGVWAVLDLSNVVDVGASAYFAAALVTIALGLLVGTWFGRARWLIALGLVTTAALGVATVAESYDRIWSIDGDVTWAPADYSELADRYESNFGGAMLDLRAVDFTNRDTQVTVVINFGEAMVVLPPEVDVTTVADVNAGDANVLGSRSTGVNGRLRETTDLGPDGAGGGKLRLYIHVNAGNLEVTR